MTPRPAFLAAIAAVSLLMLARSAQSMAAASGTETICLSPDAARLAQDASVVICGFPLQMPPDAPDVPFACHRKADSLLALLRGEAGLQTLTANKICSFGFTDATKGTMHTTLNSDVVTSKYSRPVQVRLLASVAEVVGTTQTLVIAGRGFSGVNREIFASIGPTQKGALKSLVLSGTSVASIDLSLLEPLGISHLLLVNNAQLVSITNKKGVQLHTLKELVIWNGDKSLVDCRNFQALPSGLTSIYLLQDGLEGSCALCYLPANVNNVATLQTMSKLPFHTSMRTESSFPFPLETPYSSIEPVPGPEPYYKFQVSKATRAGCEGACSCTAATTTHQATTAPAVVDHKSTSSPNASSAQAPVDSGRNSDKQTLKEINSGGGKGGCSRVASGLGVEALALVAAAVLSLTWARHL